MEKKEAVREWCFEKASYLCFVEANKATSREKEAEKIEIANVIEAAKEIEAYITGA